MKPLSYQDKPVGDLGQYISKDLTGRISVIRPRYLHTAIQHLKSYSSTLKWPNLILDRIVMALYKS